MASDPMIEIRGVSFIYPRAAAGELAFTLGIDSLTIDAGEHVACIGPSGCGKSTLVHLIAGIIKPISGEVRVAGEHLSAMSDAARRRFRLQHIGLVFQEFELLEYLSARENAMLQARLLGDSSLADAAAVVGSLAQHLGISGILGRGPRRLSQGERQRVAMCRALATKPSVILCDEPTGNLDPHATQNTLDLLLSHARERAATLLMVTHNHSVLERFDRVIDLREMTSITRTSLRGVV